MELSLYAPGEMFQFCYYIQLSAVLIKYNIKLLLD